jgi:hypothetical protein
MKRRIGHTAVGILLAGVGFGCAEWDNPTALEDLEADVEFEIAATELETFEEIEIHVEASENGSRLEMRGPRLEVEHPASGSQQVIEMEPTEHGHEAHVTFFQPGEHHVRFTGIAHRHQLRWEFGELEVEVERHHQTIGPYRVEIEVDPAPIMEGETAHVHLYAFDAAGSPVSGLDIEVEVHAPDGGETHLAAAEEEAGEYEVEYAFGEPGAYELHVEIDVGGTPEDGEFHIPVLSPIPDDTPTEGGDDHGHGH